MGTYVVHGDEVIDFTANVRLREVSATESAEGILEPVFEVRYVFVNTLRAIDFENPHASDRSFCRSITVCVQVPGFLGIGLAAPK